MTHTPIMNEEMVQTAQMLIANCGGEWEATKFLRYDGEPIQTIADIAQTMAFSSNHSERTELFGVVRKADNLVVCYTGNGPTSDMSALLLAVAPALAQIALRQHYEIGILRAALAPYVGEAPADAVDHERARRAFGELASFPKEMTEDVDAETFGPTPEDWGRIFADSTGFPSAAWAAGFFHMAIQTALRDRDRLDALNDMAKDDAPLIASDDAVKQAEDDAIAAYINDLRSFTPEEIDRELKEANDDLEEIEPWIEALSAWQRRGYKAEA